MFPFDIGPLECRIASLPDVYDVYVRTRTNLGITGSTNATLLKLYHLYHLYHVPVGTEKLDLGTCECLELHAHQKGFQTSAGKADWI